MADTEFSGELAGLESAAFNPHHTQVTKIQMNIPAVTDKAAVDYLVHGKKIMNRVYDVTIGDLPYHTVEYVEKKEEKKETEKDFVPDKVKYKDFMPAGYDFKKWNRMMRANPACCTILHTPEYEIIHSAPAHCSKVETLEIPEPMTETIPLIVKKVTSKVITKIEKFQGEAYVSKHTHPAYYNKTPINLINAKLDLVEKMIGHCKTGNERRHHCDGWQYNTVAGGMSQTLSRPDMSYTDFIKFYHAQYTDSCRPHGRLSDEDYETFEFDEFAFDYIPDKIRYEDTDELDSEDDTHFTLPKLSEPDDEIEYEVSYFTIGGPTKMIDKEVKYRAGHWLDGDVVELQKPQVRMRYSPFYVDKVPFFRRTRLRSRRGGYLTHPQWEALFGLEDVPEAVKTAPSGIHPLAPLLGMKRVSARFVDGLRFFGYTVELRRVGDSHRDVQCLIVP